MIKHIWAKHCLYRHLLVSAFNLQNKLVFQDILNSNITEQILPLSTLRTPQNLTFSYLYTQNMQSFYEMFNTSCCSCVRTVYHLCKIVHSHNSFELFRIKNLNCSMIQIKYIKSVRYLLTTQLYAGLLL